MNILAILGLLIPIGEQIASMIEKVPAGTTTALDKVLSEVNAAIASMISAASNSTVTAKDIEALRAKKEW